jgi:hypothetical protein
MGEAREFSVQCERFHNDGKTLEAEWVVDADAPMYLTVDYQDSPQSIELLPGANGPLRGEGSRAARPPESAGMGELRIRGHQQPAADE